MKKLYFISNAYDPDSSIKDVIEEHFLNFSLKEFGEVSWYELKNFYSCYYSYEKAFDSFKDGLWHIGENDHNFTSMMIIEFSLSEDNLFDCLLQEDTRFKKINIKPTKSWYYLNQDGKVKEINLKGFI